MAAVVKAHLKSTTQKKVVNEKDVVLFVAKLFSWVVGAFIFYELNVGKEITDVFWSGMCQNHVNKTGTFSEGSGLEGWDEIDVNKS